MREREHKKRAKIQGVGILQKHNTYADQLKSKIKMLETQIAKDIKAKLRNATPERKEASPRKKIKAFGKKRQSQPPSNARNLVMNIKNAKSEVKDRNDQLKLLNDMLRSSTHENTMKDKEIERLTK